MLAGLTCGMSDRSYFSISYEAQFNPLSPLISPLFLPPKKCLVLLFKYRDIYWDMLCLWTRSLWCRRIPAVLYTLILGCGAPTGPDSPTPSPFFTPVATVLPQEAHHDPLSSLRGQRPTNPPLPVHLWDLYGKTSEVPSLSSPEFSLSVETTWFPMQRT